jgi:integrase
VDVRHLRGEVDDIPALLSTWNVLCDVLYTAELIPANPMPFVGRPKAAKALPRSLPQRAVGALLEAADGDHESQCRTDWPERDLALILTDLLARLRADELRRADVGDIRTSTGDGAVIHVREKAARTAPCRSRPICAGHRGLPRQPGHPLPYDLEINFWARPFTLADHYRHTKQPDSHRRASGPDIEGRGSVAADHRHQLHRAVRRCRPQ